MFCSVLQCLLVLYLSLSGLLLGPGCRLADLARLYTLCVRIHSLDMLKQSFRDYIRKSGLAIVMDEDKVRPCVGFWVRDPLAFMLTSLAAFVMHDKVSSCC